jgi:threonine/homoserine/homoserine lactone efflux protein
LLAALGTVIITSLSGVMMPGPMFTVTLAKSLKSPWAGVMVSLGHAVVEVPVIVLVYFGVARFLQHDLVQLVLSVAGGGMIVWMGVGLFRARRELSAQGKDTSYSAFTAGILMSGLNPFFLVWWVTVGGLLLVTFLNSVGTWGLPLFVVVHWLCDLVWLAMVSFTIYRTHSFWGPRVQEIVFVILSAFLGYFGGVFIVQGIDNYFGTGLWDWVKFVLWTLGFVFVLFWVIRYLTQKENTTISSPHG